MKVFILLISLTTLNNAIQATETRDLHHINLSINKTLKVTCQKLTSNLTITRLFHHLFHESPLIKEEQIKIDYKNFSGEPRQLEFHITRPKEKMMFQITKGLFKGLTLTFAFNQQSTCKVKGNVNWIGEEKRFSKQLLNITIDHYLNRVMNFIERLT